MEVDSGFHYLLRNLRLDDPWIPPKNWESIASECGAERSSSPAQLPTSIYDLCAVSEASLVRLVINALHGVKSAIVEIDKLSQYFCSIPADRTFNRVPSLWCRSSSTHALGNMLKAIGHTGLLFFFLSEFVDHYLHTDCDVNLIARENTENFLVQPKEVHTNKIETHSSYSLVNQAFAVGVAKLLKGYVCALSTLSASVKLRRSAQSKDGSVSIKHSEAILSSVVHSEVTVLEVYLHTKELRDHVEVLGNICFSQIHKSSLSEGLNCDSVLEFQKFPRGADLLTYLYVQLRDVDACHHALLKYLFVISYEPYCVFVKSWMYRANIEDPYGEFFIVSSDSDRNSGSSTFDKFSLAAIKERPGASIPSFLKVVCHQLLRAGQQLQVLIRLLDLCSLSFSGEYVSCDLSNLRQILPFWVDSSSKLNFWSNPLTFEESAIEALIQKRETMYRSMLEKIQSYFQTLNANGIWASPTVFACGSSSMALGRRNGLNISFPSLSSGEAVFVQQDKNFEVVDSDSLSSTSSSESSNDLESLHSSNHFPPGEFNNDCRPENYYELHSSVFKQSKSMFLNLSACHANHFRRADQVPNSFKPDTIEPPRQSDGINEEYWSGKCWPIGGLLKNPLSACTECHSVKELGSTDYGCENGARNLDRFRGDEMHLCESFFSKILEVNGSRGVQTFFEKFGQFYQLTSSGFPCGSGIKPMLVKIPWLPTIQDSSERCLINGYASNIAQISFTSVEDPCKMYLQNSSSAPCYENMTEASKTVQLGGSAGECKENFGGPINEILENQSVLASSFILGETNLCAGVQHANASGESIRDLHTNASGGSNWATLLQYPVKSCTSSDKDNHSEEKFIMPLDIIIDKCVLQEILLQYKYISCFTIKFLEEGFKLHEHLLALRRYHFMEISDWADLLVLSLRRQKWSAVEHQQGSAKFQDLLDLALQRSSCANDPYRGMLFIYIEEQNEGQPVLTDGIHAFDLMVLSYRVDWPVNIVITPDALKLYANIFNYLMQIKISVASLTDVWHYLKFLTHLWKDVKHKALSEDFNMLMRIRQQINHFTSTLQLYVHYQLSDVSWCRFQASLKNMVKDVLDLESVHMLYLTDATQICFLSDDAKEVAAIVKNILQCALEFRSCFGGIDYKIHLHGTDQPHWHSQINFAKVSLVKATFEKNLRELYLMYLKSSKHREFSLCRFWSLLNYNEYYSSNMNKELGYSYL